VGFEGEEEAERKRSEARRKQRGRLEGQRAFKGV